MTDLMLYLGVFIAAAVPMLEVWIAVPAGVLAGLPVVPTALVGFLGNTLTLLPVLYAGEKIRRWVERRKARKAAAKGELAEGEPGEGEEPTGEQQPTRAQRVLKRYGVPGLALVGPGLTGVHAAAALAVASGESRRKILVWFALSIALYSLFFGILADLGLATFAEDKALPLSE